MPTDRVFRILSLDGGGCWALIQAKALLDIYGDVSGRVLLTNFDLVAANSGGSIVAAALAADFKPSDIVARFMDEGWRRRIFVDLHWYQKIFFFHNCEYRFDRDDLWTKEHCIDYVSSFDGQ